MDEELAREIAVADFSGLTEHASGLRDSIAQAPERHVQLMLAAAAGIIALLELRSETADLPLKEALKKLDVLVGVVCGAVTVLGIASVGHMARCRLHYVKVIRAINAVRKTYSESLHMEADLKTVWTDSDVAVWPHDSAATWALAGLLATLAVTSCGASVSFGVSVTQSVCVAVAVTVLGWMVAVIASRE